MRTNQLTSNPDKFNSQQYIQAAMRNYLNLNSCTSSTPTVTKGM